MDMQKDKVVVQKNRFDGMIDVLIEGEAAEQIYMICLKQGPRYAHLVGDMDLMMEIPLVPGQELTKGHIVTKERFEPWIKDDVLALLKMKNGKCCRKDGKVIYSYNYFTYNMDDVDEIIQEDD
jgi:hypothetical protein